jgi:hypothetical protein
VARPEGRVTDGALGIDPGLLGRFRAAGGRIAWRAAPRPKGAKTPKGAGRIAHLNDEEARIEERTEGRAVHLVVESGPVGALVLLLAWADRGAPNRLVTREAGEVPGFPSGALEAAWLDGSMERALAIPVADVVGLARYALA